jgi:hypothetical protein
VLCVGDEEGAIWAFARSPETEQNRKVQIAAIERDRNWRANDEIHTRERLLTITLSETAMATDWRIIPSLLNLKNPAKRRVMRSSGNCHSFVVQEFARQETVDADLRRFEEVLPED